MWRDAAQPPGGLARRMRYGGLRACITALGPPAGLPLAGWAVPPASS